MRADVSYFLCLHAGNTQGVFIDRIYRINHTETWNFNALTLVTSVSHKITAKCGILCPKTLLLTEKQLHAIQFFVATRNVCPLAIPKSCAQNMSIRLLENHSLQFHSQNRCKQQFTGIPNQVCAVTKNVNNWWREFEWKVTPQRLVSRHFFLSLRVLKGYKYFVS